MKVKIGNTVFDSEKEPIMLILNSKDKKNLSTMKNKCTKFCAFPDTTDRKIIEEWMGKP